MDETTKAVIESITERYPEARRIPSGHQSNTFYDCNRLTPNELARLAAEAIGDLPEGAFDVAVGVAYHGILFAAAVAGGRGVAILQTDGKLCGAAVKGQKVVIVDDVAHSGRRLKQAAEMLVAAGAKVVGFAVVVDRSNGRIGTSTQPLWSAFQTDML